MAKAHMKIEIRLQAPLPSLDNLHVRWQTKAGHVKRIRSQVALAWLVSNHKERTELGLVLWHQDSFVVTMTRVAPRELDDDNNISALKPVRDQIAKCLGLASDRDKRVTWVCAQRKGKPALEITIDIP